MTALERVCDGEVPGEGAGAHDDLDPEMAVRLADALGLQVASTRFGAVLFADLPVALVERMLRFVTVEVAAPSPYPVSGERVAAYWALRRGAGLDPATAWQGARGLTW